MVGVGEFDWPQWGGTSVRNNVPFAQNLPESWEIGKFARNDDGTLGEWQKEIAENVKWVSRLGSQTYGNPVVANGKVYVGTNNAAGYLDRFPPTVDLGVLACFRESDGEFLWQHSSRKLKTGRVHDWPMQGICCAPLVEGERLWYVTSRGEVVCLDTEGFDDGENDGPFTEEKVADKGEADVVWVFDFMKAFGVSQHNMCSCSVTAYGDLLFVCTGNGVDESHVKLPAPDAPSFFCIDKNTQEVYWTDNRPGGAVVHGQWSSPAAGVLGGQPQVIFAGGDGYLYSFKANKGSGGAPELLWKFDCNPKESRWELSGLGTRNNIISTPVIYEGHVFVAVGQDPEHGEGIGHLWRIDPSGRGDISPTLAVKADDHSQVLPHRRIQAVVKEEGEVAIPNPNSGAVWHFSEQDVDGDGEVAFEETMHRACGTVAIKDDILYLADFSGILHVVDAQTGQQLWHYDMFAAAWGSPLIADGRVFIGDEDGDVAIFPHTRDGSKAVVDDTPALGEINMYNSVYSTPIVANGTLFIANRTHLFAIETPKP